jgi:hypothetical protein
MIYEALSILTQELNNYLGSLGEDPCVVLNNIAFLDNEQDPGGSESMSDRVVLTLLNLNEEAALRNFPNNRVENGRIAYRNNKISLNLYILFSSNRKMYDSSLRYLAHVLGFFQGKNVFTQDNSDYEQLDPTLAALGDFRYTLELYTPTFENLNYIWGTLGGKQLPSALYKMSLVVIDRDSTQHESGIITQTDANINVNLI